MEVEADAECRVLQVSNVSPYATEKECRNLFEFFGKIDKLAMYPSAYRSPDVDTPKIVYVMFESEESVHVAQHLTETTFMDRPLVCVPAGCNRIPDEQTALGIEVPPAEGVSQFSPKLPSESVEKSGFQLSALDMECCVLQVSNVSPYATEKECRNLFEFIGKIDELAMYPSAYRSPSMDTPKIVYVKFESKESVRVAQHLTETTFMDRPLVCVPAGCNQIPDEQTALARGVPQPPPTVESDGSQMFSPAHHDKDGSPYMSEREGRSRHDHHRRKRDRSSSRERSHHRHRSSRESDRHRRRHDRSSSGDRDHHHKDRNRSEKNHHRSDRRHGERDRDRSDRYHSENNHRRSSRHRSSSRDRHDRKKDHKERN